MIYNILLSGFVDTGKLKNALSGIFGLPATCVDVSKDDDFDSRNWNAQVSAEYSVGSGDVSCSLSVYSADGVVNQPTEEKLSLQLANSLSIVIFFPPNENIPNLWRVATPRGEVAYARIWEPEYYTDAFRITDIEIPVPELPDASISKFPEVIKVLQLPTPIVDAHILGAGEGKLWKIRDLAVNWERLTVRMASGWPPSGWYPAYMYEEDLQDRDRAQRLAVEVSAEGHGPVLDMFDELDAAYRRMTVDDGGRALAEACGFPIDDLAGRRWHWLRRPARTPWETV